MARSADEAGERIMRVELPDGWRVERRDHGTHFELLLFEEGGVTWPKDGSPRSALSVDVWPPDKCGGRERAPRIGWPSTSDKRPELAVALAYALGLAAWYVDRLEFPGKMYVEVEPSDAGQGGLV
jgi:hypothetical protein